MKFKLIMAMVDPEITPKVVDAAISAGATGDVIVSARGCGIEQTKLLGITVDSRTDIILFVVEEHIVNKVLDAIKQKSDLEKPGVGIAVVLKVEKVAGLQRHITKIKDKLKEEQL